MSNRIILNQNTNNIVVVLCPKCGGNDCETEINFVENRGVCGSFIIQINCFHCGLNKYFEKENHGGWNKL